MSDSKIIIATGKIGDNTEVSIAQSYEPDGENNKAKAVVTLSHSKKPDATQVFKTPISGCSGLAFNECTRAAIEYSDKNFYNLVTCWKRVKSSFPLF